MKFNLKRMLEDIKKDELVTRHPERKILTQEEIKNLTAKRKAAAKAKKEGER